MPYFDSLVKDARGRVSSTSMSISLIDSVMAFGYQAYLAITQRFVGPEEKRKIERYARIALRSRANVLRASDTLLKLQVSLGISHQS
jgi:hypothetical protein